MTDRADASFVIYKPLFFNLGPLRFGFEFSRVGLGETPYLDRWILYIGRGCLRLHKFWRGDEDRAPHDHPWDFWTFPLASYAETEETLVGYERVRGVSSPIWWRRDNTVKAFRIHYRPAKYRHIVRGGLTGMPFYTIVFTTGVKNKWGFWPSPTTFVPWREWPAFVKRHFGAKV
jgi:hypothetical protein